MDKSHRENGCEQETDVFAESPYLGLVLCWGSRF